MRFLYVMDPMDRIVPDKDTTYAFLRAAEARGHQSFHAVPEAVFAKAGTIGVHARQVSGFGAFPQVTTGWSTGETTVLDVASFDAVFIRKDPPFDAAYLYLSHLLDRVVDQTLVVNRPRGLRDANEKLYTLNFAQFMPTTLVASSPSQILAFVEEVGGEAVLKPLDGAGGTGVFMLRTADKNARGLIDMLTGEGRRLAMVQQFLPAVTAGDKRVLLMGGKVLGGINRISRSDDFRSNIHVGGRVEPVEVTPEERHLVETIAPKLAEDGLFFVGLDLIGGKLTEVNVTSPTGIQELSAHLSRDVAEDVIEWVEAHAGAARSASRLDARS